MLGDLPRHTVGKTTFIENGMMEGLIWKVKFKLNPHSFGGLEGGITMLIQCG